MKPPIKLPAPINPRRYGLFRLTYLNFSLWAPVIAMAVFLALPAKLTHSGELFAPIANFLASPIQNLRTGMANVAQWKGAVEENQALKQRLATLEALNLQTRLQEAENARLANLLNLKSPQWVFQVSALVTASSGGAFSRSVMVSAGSNDGVEKWDVAVTPKGILGRVVEVFEKSSLVLLVTDFNSKIPVMAQDNSLRAIMSGDNSPFPLLDFVEPANAKMVAGAELVTSGHGGHFAPGMQVGKITADGRVQPAAMVGSWVSLMRYQRK